MKTRIRQSTFETNSSSIHTLILPKGECKTGPKQTEGILKVSCDDFSDSGVIYGFMEKLSYLVSFAILECCIEEKETSSEDCWLLKDILEGIQRRLPSITELKVKNCHKAKFDHQTHPCNSSCIINLWDPEMVETFLFNDEIKVLMGRD